MINHENIALIWLGCLVVVLGLITMRLAREYESLYMDYCLSETENRALFKELQHGRSSTA